MSSRPETGPFDVPLPSRAPRTVWEESLQEDPGAPRKFEVSVPMRDGLELAADVYLPAAATLPQPAIVLGTPYDKSSPIIDDVRPYQEAGYAAVIYDVRGRGKSEGVWAPFAADGPDGHDIVEWVAAQEWCDGKVAVTGLSYSGWVAWATIRERPAHLAASVTASPCGRFQEELPYTYGCYWLYFAFWFSFVRRRIVEGRDLSAMIEILPVAAIADELRPAGPGWEEFLAHDTLDELWRSRRWDGEYDIDLPCLHITGWHDREDIWGAFHHYEHMIEDSPARDRQWLLVGPWSHVSTRNPSESYAGVETPGAALDIVGVHLRFFDRFLRDESNGMDDEPRVQLYDPGEMSWKVRPDWRGETEEAELFLAAAGTLGESPGAAGCEIYRYDPEKPNGVPFDVNAVPWEPPLDLVGLEGQDGVVVWTSEPLVRDLTVRGWGGVDLWAATDGEDTDWHTKLADVEPHGRSLFVAWGALRASYGEDASNPRPVTPGEERKYEIELTPVFHTFKQGHRIRLVLASSEFPWFARNLNRFGPIAAQSDPRVALNTVHFGGSRRSCLRLPVERRP